MARVRVEVVDDDDPGAAAGECPRLVDVVRRHPRAGLVAAAVAVALAVAVVAGQGVLDARERARLAALGAVPGVLRPVELPLRARFTAVAEAASALQGGAVFGNLRIGGGAAGVDVPPPVTAVDVRTGAVVWQVTVSLPPSQQRPQEAEHGLGATYSAVACTADGEQRRLGCVVTRAFGVLLDPDGAYVGEIAVRSAVTLDVRDGTVLWRHDEAPGVTVAVVDGGYWAMTRVPGGTGLDVAVTSFDGAPRWTRHVDVGAATAQPWVPSVVEDGERTLLSVGARGWFVDPRDGSVSQEVGPHTVRGRVEPARGGALVLTPGPTPVPSAGGDGALGRAAWWRDDGRVVDLGDASPLPLTVDDGSRSDLLLVVRGWGTGPLLAKDRTGATRWQARVPAGTGALVLDGIVVVAGGALLSGVGLDDGALRWQTPLPAPVEQVLTDGRLVLTALGAQVRAYDVRDGQARWSARLVRDGGTLELRADPTGAPTEETFGWWWVTDDGSLARTFADRSGTSSVAVFGQPR